ncbi:hypothetical protein HDU79_003422 [Rhizoclosmatium sp. JEL0117]|nr:hypothetical protein HDU79_003422 [Rhizoclosmatium sp. JEL0117]
MGVTVVESVIDAVQANLFHQSGPDPSVYTGVEKRDQAAVLIPLILDPNTDSVSVILTRRALGRESYPGEVEFAGDHMQDVDSDIVDTAERGALEGIGLDPMTLQFAGILKPFTNELKLLVTPVIAYVDIDSYFGDEQMNPNECDASLAAYVVNNLQPNPALVESAFSVPLDYFLHTKDYTVHQFEADDGSGRTWQFGAFNHIEDEFGRDFRVWGQTAHLLINVATLALGRKPDFQVVEHDPRPEWTFGMTLYKEAPLVILHEC